MKKIQEYNTKSQKRLAKEVQLKIAEKYNLPTSCLKELRKVAFDHYQDFDKFLIELATRNGTTKY